MKTAKLFQEFTKQFSEHWPPHLSAFKTEFDQHVQQCLEQALAKLNLVTKQEFDIQVDLLARLQEKLAQLEEKLVKLQSMESEHKS